MEKMACINYKLDRSEFTFQCHSCGYEKQINGKYYQKLKYCHKVRIKCKCGIIQWVTLERRKNNRITAKLPGVFFHTNSDGQPDFKDIDIRDISLTGMCFKISDGSICEPTPEKNVLVVFQPSDNTNSLITKEAAIKNFQDNYYHVEFHRNDNLCENLKLKILLYS